MRTTRSTALALLLWGVRPPVLLLCLIVHAAVAQEPAPPAVRFEGRIVTRVDFEPPDQPLPRDELDRLLPFRSGEPLRAADVRTAIQKLYSTGRYTDVAVDAQLNELGVALHISTELAWFVAGVTFDGVADPPNRGQLNTAAKLELGAPFADPDIRQAMERIQERLRSNGLRNATIVPKVQRDPKTEEASIHFTINSGARARFDGVDVDGKVDVPLDKIIHQAHWLRGLGPLDFKFLGYREDRKSVV